MSPFSFHGKKVGYCHQIGITNFLREKHDILQNYRLNQIPLDNKFKAQFTNPRIYLGKMREESVIQGLLDWHGFEREIGHSPSSHIKYKFQTKPNWTTLKTDHLFIVHIPILWSLLGRSLQLIRQIFFQCPHHHCHHSLSRHLHHHHFQSCHSHCHLIVSKKLLNQWVNMIWNNLLGYSLKAFM